MTFDPSSICKDGTDEGSRSVVLRGQRSRLDVVAGEEGGQWCSGDRPTVGLILVQQPRGEDERKARCEDQQFEVLGIDVEVGDQPAGHILVLSREARTRREPWLGPVQSHPRRTMARSLWICLRRAGPAAE